MDRTRIKLKPKTRTIIEEWIFIIVSITSLMHLYYFITWWGLSSYLNPGIFNDCLETGFEKFSN